MQLHGAFDSIYLLCVLLMRRLIMQLLGTDVLAEQLHFHFSKGVSPCCCARGWIDLQLGLVPHRVSCAQS